MTTSAFEGNEKILVVDDQEELLELTQEFLRPLGYRVSIATDGWQALNLISRDDEISLLFSDVAMPGGMNGFELADQAIELRPNLKILLTSGYPKDCVSQCGSNQFADNILKKPYTQMILATEIKTILDER